MWVGGYMKKPKVESVRQAPNALIAPLQKIVSPPAYCMSLVHLWPA